MLPVSEKYSQAIKADTRKTLHRVTIANSIVLDQTSVPKMTLNENVGGTSGVMLGTSNSASLQLTLRDPAVADYTDVLVVPESGIELSDGTIEWLPLGKFYVTDSSTSNDYKTVELTCADGMYLMSGDYVSALTYPAHVRDVALEIAEQAGVEFVELEEWPNVSIRRKPEKLTLRAAIGYVAGCCGKVAKFNRYGKLEFAWYKDTGLTIEREQQYLDGFARLNDQSLNINFNITGKVETYSVTINSDDNGNVIATPGTNVLEGDVVTLSIVPFYQYALSRINAMTSNGVPVSLWQNANGDEYTFIQPDDDVVITASFVLTNGSPVIPVVGGEYSYLQHPSLAEPPTSKPYWAIFYKHATDVGANAKYYLVWFDSWSLGESAAIAGKDGYFLTIKGYYYCQGENNGQEAHRWADSTWQGNGSDSLKWSVGVGRWHYGYGLLASNTSLGDVFEANDTEVGTTQTSPIVGGVDVREKGALSIYACPDTYSTPLPGKNWMLTNRARVYKKDADGNYTSLFDGSSTYIMYFDSYAVESLGNYYSSNSARYYKFTFPKLTIVPYVGYDGFSTLTKTIEEECYAIICDPNYSSDYGSGGGLEYPIGLYATNFTIQEGGLLFYNNNLMVCDCASATSEVGTFAMRRSVGATVTIDYTNPLITAKMIDDVSATVEGVAYTPSRVKHRGNPAFETGDIVTVPDKDGNYHTVLIIQQTMSFGGGMNATITCQGQTEKKASFSTTGALSTQIREAVQEESFYQKKESDNYNHMVVSALNRTMSSLTQQVTNDSVVLRSLTEWRSATDVALTEISTEVKANSASVSLLVKDGKASGSLIISAINGESTAKISADRLDIEGKTLNIKVDATNITGTLTANKINATGLVLGTWTVKDGYIGTMGAAADTFFLSQDGHSAWVSQLGASVPCVIYATNKFVVTKLGDVFLTGSINANGGSIGGFNVDNSGALTKTTSDSVYTDKVSVSPSEISTSREHSSYTRSTKITPFGLDIALSGIGVSPSSSFMTVTINGTDYGLYIDTATNTVKVIPAI